MSDAGGTHDLDGLLALAESAARQAGRLALEGRRSATGLDQTTKSSMTDIVTQYDRAAEAAIVELLLGARPEDAIIGEEGTDREGSSGYGWYVDPIDGTTNFVYDQPAWATSVAVSYEGEMLAGAVYVPVADELFAAALGRGATLNGVPISVSGATVLGQALVGTGFAYRADIREQQAKVVANLIGAVRDIRRLGSAAVDLCYVAAARLDVYYEEHLNSWDAAAGELIAREAGAVTSDYAGSHPRFGQLVAATPAIHTAFLAALRNS